MNADVKQSSATHVAVVGGGMLGLTIAFRLVQQNIKVTLLESAPTLGGLTQSIDLSGIHWDKFYHVTMLSDIDLRALLTELNLEHEIRWKTTKTHFYSPTGQYPLNNALDYLKLPIMGLIDKLRLGLTIMYASKIENGTALEKYPVSDWLTKLSGKTAYSSLWRPLLKAKLGSNHDKVSAAFIWAVIRRFYAARRGGLKTEMFGYVPGGYQRIIRKLVAVMPAHYFTAKTASHVTKIERNSEGKMIVSAPKEQHAFDHVIVTSPSQQVATLCPQLCAQEKQQHSQLRYQGIICPSVVLKKSIGGAYLTYITDDSVPFTAVIEMSSLVDFDQNEHPHLVYLPKYVPADDPLFDSSDQEIEALFLTAFLKMYSNLNEDDIVAFSVSRVRHVVALSTLNYSEHLPKMQTSVKGLTIVNSAQIKNASLSVQETVKLANESVKEIMKTLSTHMET